MGDLWINSAPTVPLNSLLTIPEDLTDVISGFLQRDVLLFRALTFKRARLRQLCTGANAMFELRLRSLE